MTSPDKLAFAVDAMDAESIVFAKSAPQAKMKVVTHLRGIGWLGKREWPSGIRAWREPKLDKAYRDWDRWTVCHKREDLAC